MQQHFRSRFGEAAPSREVPSKSAAAKHLLMSHVVWFFFPLYMRSSFKIHYILVF